MKEDKNDENRKKDKSTNSVKNIHDQHYKNETNKNTPDPSAKRNIGLGGDTERNNQKDNLANLKIKGNEVTGYGGNDSENIGENAQGPGFESEGSDVKGNPTRRDADEGFNANENAR